MIIFCHGHALDSVTHAIGDSAVVSRVDNRNKVTPHLKYYYMGISIRKMLILINMLTNNHAFY